MIDLSGLLFSLDTRAPLIGVTKTGTTTFGGSLAAGATAQQTITLAFDRTGVVTDTYFERSTFAGIWFSVTNLQGGKTQTDSSGSPLPTTITVNYTPTGATVVVRVTNQTGAAVTITPTTYSIRAQTLNNVFDE